MHVIQTTAEVPLPPLSTLLSASLCFASEASLPLLATSSTLVYDAAEHFKMEDDTEAAEEEEENR